MDWTISVWDNRITMGLEDRLSEHGAPTIQIDNRSFSVMPVRVLIGMVNSPPGTYNEALRRGAEDRLDALVGLAAKLRVPILAKNALNRELNLIPPPSSGSEPGKHLADHLQRVRYKIANATSEAISEAAKLPEMGRFRELAEDAHPQLIGFAGMIVDNALEQLKSAKTEAEMKESLNLYQAADRVLEDTKYADQPRDINANTAPQLDKDGDQEDLNGEQEKKGFGRILSKVGKTRAVLALGKLARRAKERDSGAASNDLGDSEAPGDVKSVKSRAAEFRKRLLSLEKAYESGDGTVAKPGVSIHAFIHAVQLTAGNTVNAIKGSKTMDNLRLIGTGIKRTIKPVPERSAGLQTTTETRPAESSSSKISKEEAESLLDEFVSAPVNSSVEDQEKIVAEPSPVLSQMAAAMGAVLKFSHQVRDRLAPAERGNLAEGKKKMREELQQAAQTAKDWLARSSDSLQVGKIREFLNKPEGRTLFAALRAGGIAGLSLANPALGAAVGLGIYGHDIARKLYVKSREPGGLYQNLKKDIKDDLDFMLDWDSDGGARVYGLVAGASIWSSSMILSALPFGEMVGMSEPGSDTLAKSMIRVVAMQGFLRELGKAGLAYAKWKEIENPEDWVQQTARTASIFTGAMSAVTMGAVGGAFASDIAGGIYESVSGMFPQQPDVPAGVAVIGATATAGIIEHTSVPESTPTVEAPAINTPEAPIATANVPALSSTTPTPLPSETPVSIETPASTETLTPSLNEEGVLAPYTPWDVGIPTTAHLTFAIQEGNSVNLQMGTDGLPTVIGYDLGENPDGVLDAFTDSENAVVAVVAEEGFHNGKPLLHIDTNHDGGPDLGGVDYRGSGRAQAVYSLGELEMYRSEGTDPLPSGLDLNNDGQLDIIRMPDGDPSEIGVEKGWFLPMADGSLVNVSVDNLHFDASANFWTWDQATTFDGEQAYTFDQSSGEWAGTNVAVEAAEATTGDNSTVTIPTDTSSSNNQVPDATVDQSVGPTDTTTFDVTEPAPPEADVATQQPEETQTTPESNGVELVKDDAGRPVYYIGENGPTTLVYGPEGGPIGVLQDVLARSHSDWSGNEIGRTGFNLGTELNSLLIEHADVGTTVTAQPGDTLDSMLERYNVPPDEAAAFISKVQSVSRP